VTVDSAGAWTLHTTPQDGMPAVMLRTAPGDSLRFALSSHRLMEPDVLGAIGRFERFLSDLDAFAVGRAIGPATLIETTHFLVSGRQESARSIPGDPEQLAWLWQQYQRVRGPERTREVVDPERQRGLVTVLMKNANFVDTKQLIERIDAYAAAHLEPIGVRVSLAGDVAVSQALIAAVVSTQVRSLLLSLAGIFVVTWILNRSAKLSMVALVPCTLAVAANFAAMGWGGIPLGVATSMFAGMTLGVGVDYAIHLVERYRRESASAPTSGAALAAALESTGPAIVVDGLAVALSFGILTLSQVPANASLGGLAFVCIASCLTATLLILPPLLGIVAPVGSPPKIGVDLPGG